MLDESLDARGDRIDAQAFRAGQPVGLRVDTHQRNGFELVAGQSLDLDEQIGTDVPRADDGHLRAHSRAPRINLVSLVLFARRWAYSRNAFRRVEHSRVR